MVWLKQTECHRIKDYYHTQSRNLFSEIVSPLHCNDLLQCIQDKDIIEELYTKYPFHR